MFNEQQVSHLIGMLEKFHTLVALSALTLWEIKQFLVLLLRGE
jgi:hypothetical protein